MFRALFVSIFGFCVVTAEPTIASQLKDEINRASPIGANDTGELLIIKSQVLLDRAHVSAGEVDGFDGDNFRRAIRAVQEVRGLAVTGKLDRDTWSALGGDDSHPPIRSYTISTEDVAGPFTNAIPADLSGMAKLPGLSYLGPISEIAEKFHMSQSLLRRLNPGVDFRRAGTEILVADVSEMKLRAGATTVETAPLKEMPDRIATTIVVNKPAHNVRAYNRSGQLVGFYPATLGSEEKPAPKGVFKVKSVVWNPKYYYDPQFAWKEVKINQKLTVAEGPNNPVGLVWIDLSAPSYGIHGTPAPDDIGKTQSHGCVRLTNWDAVDLASMVRPGTSVQFEEEDSPVTLAKREQTPRTVEHQRR